MAVVHPGKHRYEEGKEAKESKATLSENYSGVRGKRCVIVDDVITTGGTIEETIKLIQDEGGEAVAVAVIIDKKGVDSINSVPVRSLIKVGRVG
jgi:orotate phosphoribosyltransferase